MLAEAKSRAAESGIEFTPIQLDILRLPQDAKLPDADLVVCLRFINWLSMQSVAIALENLTRINETHMILGASTTPTNSPWFLNLKNRWKLSRQNAKRGKDKLAPIYVHPESEIRA